MFVKQMKLEESSYLQFLEKTLQNLGEKRRHFWMLKLFDYEQLYLQFSSVENKILDIHAKM